MSDIIKAAVLGAVFGICAANAFADRMELRKRKQRDHDLDDLEDQLAELRHTVDAIAWCYEKNRQ